MDLKKSFYILAKFIVLFSFLYAVYFAYKNPSFNTILFALVFVLVGIIFIHEVTKRIDKK